MTHSTPKATPTTAAESRLSADELLDLIAAVQQASTLATAAADGLAAIFDGSHIPVAVFPSLHASRRAAQTLATHLNAARRLLASEGT